MAKTNAGSPKALRYADKIDQYKSTISEINTMAASNQLYDIVRSDDYSKGGTFETELRGATRFNMLTGAVEFVLPNCGGTMFRGLFAHELKHGYQFEVGELSFNKPNVLGYSKLHDMGDETAAYQRGALFGQSQMPMGLYTQLPLTDNNIAKMKGLTPDCIFIPKLIDYVRNYGIVVRYNEKTYY